VLLGAPGSGKSTIGDELGQRGIRWRSWEPYILERWGTRDAFVAVKDVALPELHREIRAWIDADQTPAVIETTGLSDASFLDALVDEYACLVVRLDASEEEALRRVATRRGGEHLSDDVGANRAVWRAFAEYVAPSRRVDLVVDTQRTDPAAAARHIIDRLEE
jgi:adenylate kinase family enzyme